MLLRDDEAMASLIKCLPKDDHWAINIRFRGTSKLNMGESTTRDRLTATCKQLLIKVQNSGVKYSTLGPGGADSITARIIYIHALSTTRQN